MTLRTSIKPKVTNKVSLALIKTFKVINANYKKLNYEQKKLFINRLRAHFR